LLCWGQSGPGFSVFVKAPVCIWFLRDGAARRSNPGPNVRGPGSGDRWRSFHGIRVVGIPEQSEVRNKVAELVQLARQQGYTRADLREMITDA
jgi:hypothetical protein